MRTIGWFPPAVSVAWTAALCLLAAPARAEDAQEDRLRRLEETVRAQAEDMERLRRAFEAYRREHPAADRPTDDEIARSVDAYLAAMPNGALAVAGPPPSRGLQWGGYLTLEFLDDSDANSRLDLHRLVLDASASVSPCIDFDAELEIEHGGISDEIAGEIKLEQAKVSFHLSEALTAKAGWLLVPFARYNLHHDDPLNDFTLRPFTARYLVPTGFGQPGLGIEGAFPLPGGHLLAWDVALTNGFSDDFSPSSGVREARQARDTNDGKQAWGRAAVAWRTSFFDALETGLSATWGIYDEADQDAVRGVALDLLLRRGPFELKGEWIAYAVERDAGDPPDAVEGMQGLWAEAAWHFFPAPWRCVRTCLVTDTSLFTLAARYQWMDLDDSRRGASYQDDLEAWSVGLNYRVTEDTVIRLDHTWYLPERGDDRGEWAASLSTYF